MSSGLDWERFGVITGGDEVCILPPPTLSEKGVGIPTLSISLSLIKLHLASLPLASSYSHVAVSSVCCAQNIFFRPKRVEPC